MCHEKQIEKQKQQHVSKKQIEITYYTKYGHYEAESFKAF